MVLLRRQGLHVPLELKDGGQRGGPEHSLTCAGEKNLVLGVFLSDSIFQTRPRSAVAVFPKCVAGRRPAWSKSLPSDPGCLPRVGKTSRLALHAPSGKAITALLIKHK
eukprot:13141656-Heterocapsa_arctica.AAC.1